MTMNSEMLEAYRTADQAATATASMLAKLHEVRAGMKRARGGDGPEETAAAMSSSTVGGGRLQEESSSAMEESEEEDEEELEVGDEDDDGEGRPLDLRRNSDESSEEDEEDEDDYFRPIKQGLSVGPPVCSTSLFCTLLQITFIQLLHCKNTIHGIEVVQW